MAKTFGTTNMSVYLRNKHPELYKEFEKKVEVLKEAKKALEKSGESRASRRQLSLIQCKYRILHWGINDICAQRIHRQIGEMIALDTHSSL